MLPLYCLFPCLSMIPMSIIQFAVFLFKANYDIDISFSRFSLYITDVLFRVNSVPKCPFISIILTWGNPDLFPDFSIFIFFFSYIKNTCISRCTVSSFHRIMIYHVWIFRCSCIPAFCFYRKLFIYNQLYVMPSFYNPIIQYIYDYR